MRNMNSAAFMVVVVLVVLPVAVFAAQEISPGLLVSSPGSYGGRNVTIAVTFEQIESRFLPWEESENLAPNRKIKFSVKPLGEISCFADRNLKNEKILGTLQAGQEITLDGYLKKGKKEFKTKVKGEYLDRKETIKTGKDFYYFVVKQIETGEGEKEVIQKPLP
jgi:hypothetical protein